MPPKLKKFEQNQNLLNNEKNYLEKQIFLCPENELLLQDEVLKCRITLRF